MTTTRITDGRTVRRAVARPFRWSLRSEPHALDVRQAAADGCGGCDCAGCGITPAPQRRQQPLGRRR